MSTVHNIKGTSKLTFQVGKNGPNLKKALATRMSVRDDADSALAQMEGADPSAAQDFLTKVFFETNVVNGFAIEASPDQSTDYVVIWDASVGAHRKVLLSTLPTKSKYNRGFGISNSNKGFIESSSGAYETIARMIFPGTNSLAVPNDAKVVLSRTNSGPVSVQLYDVTNGNIIAEGNGLTPGTDPLFSIENLGAISNLPAAQAIFEIKIKIDAPGNKVRIAAFHFRET